MGTTMATKTFRWVGPVAEEDVCATLFGGKSTNIGTNQGQEVVDHLEDNDSNQAHIILSSNGGSAFIAVSYTHLTLPTTPYV